MYPPFQSEDPYFIATKSLEIKDNKRPITKKFLRMKLKDACKTASLKETLSPFSLRYAFALTLIKPEMNTNEIRKVKEKMGYAVITSAYDSVRELKPYL